MNEEIGIFDLNELNEDYAYRIQEFILIHEIFFVKLLFIPGYPVIAELPIPFKTPRIDFLNQLNIDIYLVKVPVEISPCGIVNDNNILGFLTLEEVVSLNYLLPQS